MINIKKKDYNILVEYSKQESPNEACAILAGKNNSISRIYLMKNIQEQPDSFLMAPEEQFKVIKDIRKKKLEMLGIFHTHPDSPARPSIRDISMAFYTEVVYFILSLEDSDNPLLKGFRIIDREVSNEEIKIKE